MGSLLDPSLSQRSTHATADSGVFKLHFYSRRNVLTVTKVKMTTTIYDTDDTAMLNSDRRPRDRNCVTATITLTLTLNSQL